MFGDGADHVKASGLGMNRRAHRIWPAILRNIQLDAFHFGFRVKHGRPRPGGNGHMDFVILRGNSHHFAATECNWTHILVTTARQFYNFIFSSIDLIIRVRKIKIHKICRFAEALGVFFGFEDFATVRAFTFEHAGAIMQAMGEHMHFRIFPWNDFAIEPNVAVALIKRNDGHWNLLNYSTLQLENTNRTG